MLPRLLLVLFLFAPLTLSAGDVKPYPLTTCIVSGDKIDPSVPPVVYNGQQVKFCCKSCVKKFQSAPEKYLIKLPKQ